jgi:hypothetical protein
MMLTIGMLHLQQYCLIRWHYEFLYIKEGLRMLQTLIVRIPIETIALDTQTAFVLKHDSVIYTANSRGLSAAFIYNLTERDYMITV